MNTLKEPTMIGHRYTVIAEPTTALCGDRGGVNGTCD